MALDVLAVEPGHCPASVCSFILLSSISHQQLVSDGDGEKQALKCALDRGLEQAHWIGQTIGQKTVRLPTIERRGAMRSPLLRSAASTVAFDPDEAPNPQISLHLQLTYCLS